MKKKLLFPFWPLGAVWWLMIGGCHKADKDSISGSVLEYGTEKPIEGAVVKLFGWSGDPLSGGSTYFVDSTITDANGNYHFNNDAKFARSMTANAYKSLYWTGYDSETVVADGNYDNTNIHLKPYAWLKIKAINKNGQYFYFIGPGEAISNVPVEKWVNQNDSIVYHQVVKGNLNFPFLFGILDKPNGTYLRDTSKFSFFIDSKRIKLEAFEAGGFPYIAPLGHDTTNITINY